MDNIHACTDEEIDWSPMPAVLRAENWALIRVLRSIRFLFGEYRTSEIEKGVKDLRSSTGEEGVRQLKSSV